MNLPGEDPSTNDPARVTTSTRPERTRRRIGTKLLVTDGDRVLLVREQRDDGSTFWTLPGGGVEADESLAEGLRREIDEELQCDCVVGQLVTICTYRHTSRPNTETVYGVFDGKLRSSPAPNTEEGITGCEWHAPGDLPPSLLDPFRPVVSGLPPSSDGTPSSAGVAHAAGAAVGRTRLPAERFTTDPEMSE